MQQLNERTSNGYRRHIRVVLSTLVVTVLAACGSSGGSSSDNTVTTLPGTTITGETCPTGQVYTDAAGCVASTTFTGTYIGAMSGIDRSQFDLMLKYMGYCNQYTLVNLGNESCSTYDSSAYVILQVGLNNTDQAALYAGASSPYSGGGIPIQFGGSMNPINNNEGFVIQSGSGLQLYIDTGTLGGSSLPAHVVYQGTTIGTLTLTLNQ